MRRFAIAGREIGQINNPPYVIAEVSANHGGSLHRARRIVELAAEAGADAVKFQAYTADELTIDCDRADFVISADNAWRGERLHRLYETAATPYAWFPELFAHARALGLTPFASIFSIDSIETFEALDVDAYKIASFEAVDRELIAACAATGKPVIISTGLCDLDEMSAALDTVHAAGGADVALLRCNSAYPADPAEANLLTIADMLRRFEVPIGYSDHTTTALQSIVAVGLGASIVEKHLIDAREPATADSHFSSLPGEFRDLVDAVHAAHAARGDVVYGPSPRERQSIVFRRSLYAVQDIEPGARFTRENVRSIRPGFGLAPDRLTQVLAGVAARRIARGEPLDWSLVG